MSNALTPPGADPNNPLTATTPTIGTVSADYPPWMTQPSNTWQPSTWQPGMNTTHPRADLSHLPMPTQQDIENQRQVINKRLSDYGYAPQTLSDNQVLNTMAPLPQPAQKWDPWVEEFFQKNPKFSPDQPGRESQRGARGGVDVPFDQTYEPWNLAHPALNRSQPTTVGVGGYEIPEAALVYRYGNKAVDQMHQDWVLQGHTPAQQALMHVVTETRGGPEHPIDFGGPDGASKDPKDRMPWKSGDFNPLYPMATGARAT